MLLSKVYVIFSVIDCWQPFANPSQRERASASGQSIGVLCRENEAQQNRHIIDAAAKVSTLKRIVLSSLPNTNKLSGGKYAHVYLFEGKAMGRGVWQISPSKALGENECALCGMLFGKLLWCYGCSVST
jgi:hypothetical protein